MWLYEPFEAKGGGVVDHSETKEVRVKFLGPQISVHQHLSMPSGPLHHQAYQYV
jgi:hypothetical protein